MKFFRPIPAALLLILGAGLPAFAQMPGSSLANPNGNIPSAPAQQVPPNIAPPGLPGAGQAPVATGPVMQKPPAGDPTQALFAAVNKGDYNAAQDAISRGADLTAHDAFGETPLDLSIALNRSNITFLILQARNEDGGGNGIAPGPAFPPGSGTNLPSPALDATPARAEARPALPVMGNDPGKPDPSSGFLGFGGKD